MSASRTSAAARVAEQFRSVKKPPIEGGEPTPWADPLPLGEELPPVDPFYLDLLPEALSAACEDISERMQVPLDYPGAATIVALAGCVNRRAVIIPKRRDATWRVVPNLWGAIIGPPGTMKSPILHAITQPLARVEEDWHADYERELRAFLRRKEEADLCRQVWREQYKSVKKGGKKGAKLPLFPDFELVGPKQRRLVLSDSTFEKLHEILADNPAGVLMLRDELGGWLAMLDREGREGERPFMLSAWNGDTGHTIDRIGRGSIHVPACCVSLLGNLQPSRFNWYLAQALEGRLADDGLMQRIQVLVWPDPTPWRLVDRPPNEAAIEQMAHVFARLAVLSPEKPVTLRFAEDAQELFFSWLSDLETKIRLGFLGPALTAHFSKYRSLMPSLAGLFELADRAAANESLAADISISLDHTGRAAAFCDYLESHARRVYSRIVSPELHAAHDLARHARAGDLGIQFSTREVYLKGWSGLDTAERVRAALEILVDVVWVRPAKAAHGPDGGRPSEQWEVNPKLGVKPKPRAGQDA